MTIADYSHVTEDVLRDGETPGEIRPAWCCFACIACRVAAFNIFVHKSLKVHNKSCKLNGQSLLYSVIFYY